MSTLTSAVHRTILCADIADIAGFGDRQRTHPHQVAAREGLYRGVEQAFQRSGIDWDRTYREDRGDGLFALIPADVPKHLLVTDFLRDLARALAEHNQTHDPRAQIRLRLALHAGEIQPDGHGVAGTALNLAFRLLDAEPLKRELARSSGALALIASQWFFEEVIEHSPASMPRSYRQVHVSVKETRASAWICLPDSPYPPGADHWAHRVADRFPDGQLYVNLRGFDPAGPPMPPGEAVRGFLDAFEVPTERIPAGLDAQAALYRSLLTGRRMLVVLDNARDADQVRPLLPGFPGCVVLVTSRNQLTSLIVAEGARPLTLDLLAVAEARQLLIQRLGHRRVGAEHQAVEEIITLCARLPLALSVVAARAAAHPAFPLATLAAQLRETRGGLDGFDRGDLATDVRVVFSWSYRQLSDETARVFRLPGGLGVV